MRNGFCFLVDRLPTKIGHLPIDSRASTAIAITLKLKEDCSDFEKTTYICSKLFGTDFDTAYPLSGLKAKEDFFSGILDFLSGPPEVRSWSELHAEASKTGENKEFGKRHKSTPPDFDFTQDSGSIIASFRQVYHLSIDETCDLHWWEFLELFRNLPPEGNSFGNIRSIRNRKPDPKATPEQKDALRKAKRQVALKDTRSPEQKAKARQAMFNSLEL